MIGAHRLAKAFGRNTSILKMQAAGLSHEDSLLQTPYRINCFNWTLGHILVYRDRTLQTAGGEPQFPNNELARYMRESEPITEDGPGVLPMEELVAAITTSQDAIDNTLGELSDEAFSAESEIDGRMVSIASRIHFDYFHDTYHTGQTEILRQVAGMDDQII
ncbi:MAG: DinB family protein [Acidimicrobiia bacterium]|nr:DinB family protein [Acidimicrobiia bacterium]MDX2466487.1 DinB family protein [Acidimicrobiia bacterium]